MGFVHCFGEVEEEGAHNIRIRGLQPFGGGDFLVLGGQMYHGKITESNLERQHLVVVDEVDGKLPWVCVTRGVANKRATEQVERLRGAMVEVGLAPGYVSALGGGHVYGALNSENDGYKWIANTLTIISGLCQIALAIYVGRAIRDGMLFTAKHAIQLPEKTPEEQLEKARTELREKLRAQRAAVAAAAPDHDVERGEHDR